MGPVHRRAAGRHCVATPALAGIEKVRIVPGITAANPLDLYYMPYTHSLVAALMWSVAAAVVCRLVFRWKGWGAAAWVGAAVLSHWVLDWLVHRPDLPLYGNTAKVGLGLWNYVGISLVLEVVMLLGGVWTTWQRREDRRRRVAMARWSPWCRRRRYSSWSLPSRCRCRGDGGGEWSRACLASRPSPNGSTPQGAAGRLSVRAGSGACRQGQ